MTTACVPQTKQVFNQWWGGDGTNWVKARTQAEALAAARTMVNKHQCIYQHCNRRREPDTKPEFGFCTMHLNNAARVLHLPVAKLMQPPPTDEEEKEASTL